MQNNNQQNYNQQNNFNQQNQGNPVNEYNPNGYPQGNNQMNNGAPMYNQYNGGQYMPSQPPKKKLPGCVTAFIVFVWIIIFSSIFGSISKGKDRNDDTDSHTKIESVEQGGTKDDKKDVTDKKEDSANDENNAVDDEGNTEGQLTASIDEQVLWEVDGVKITATGLETDTFWGAEVKLLIENDSDKDVGIGSEVVIVNDYMITDLFSSEVSAGKKANESITLFSREFKAAGIDNIGKIELYLYTYDPNTYDTLKESECITIKTSDYDNMDTEAEITGTILFDQDGIKVTAQYVDENSFWGKAVVMLVENNTDKIINVNSSNVSVNGFMINDYYYTEVYPHKKSVDDMEFFNSDLEENGIENIEEVELTIEIYDEDYNDIAVGEKKVIYTK